MYNYYEVVNAINSLTSYVSNNIFPLLLVILLVNCSILTISIIRWFKK